LRKIEESKTIIEDKKKFLRPSQNSYIRRFNAKRAGKRLKKAEAKMMQKLKR